jgi:hypothetical protein
MGKYTKISKKKYADGGPKKKTPIAVNDLNDPRLKAYADSSAAYNLTTKYDPIFKANTTDPRMKDYDRAAANITRKTGIAPATIKTDSWEDPMPRNFSPGAMEQAWMGRFKKPTQPYIYAPRQETLNIPPIQYNPKDTNPYNKYVVNRYLPTPQSPSNPIPVDDIQLYSGHQNLANQGRPVGQIHEDGKWREISLDEYNSIMGSSVQGGTKLEHTNYAMGGKLNKKYAMGGRMNQAQQLNAAKMRMGSDAPDGEVWKGIGAGAYGVLEGTLDTVTMGATDKLTDAGYKGLQKLGGSGNTRQQDMIRGFGNIGGAVVGAVVNPASTKTAISQGIKGLGQGVGNINENTQGIGNAISGLSSLTGLMPSGGGATGEQTMAKLAQGFQFKQGGLMHINEGGTHEQNALGGVPIGPNALVEQGETINNDFVFSDRLKPKGSKKTYAQLSKSVDTKYRLRPDDKLSKEAKQMDLDRLAMQQETQKDEMSTKYMQKAMACGGKIMSNGGSFMGPISQSMNVTNGQNTLLANGGLMSNFMEKPTVYQNPANLNNQYKYGGNMYALGGNPLNDPNVRQGANNLVNLGYIPEMDQTIYDASDFNESSTDLQGRLNAIKDPYISNLVNARNPFEVTSPNTEANFMGQKQGNAFDKYAGSNQNPYPEVGNTGYLTNLAGNLVKAGMVATSKPPIYNPSLKFNRMNANPAERLAMQEGRREIQGTKDIIRNNATSSGQYLTNASLMGSSAANKLAGTIGGIRQQYDNQNVGIGNQEAQLNQQITAGNNLAKEQFRDNRLNQYNKILDSVIGANQQKFATDVHANNFQNQVISLLKTGVYHMGKVDADGMYEILGPNNEVISKVPPALLKS